MSVIRIVPDFSCRSTQPAVSFYTALFGLDVSMDLGWIVTLTDRDNPAVQVSLLTGDATAPLTPDVSIEVDDVDRVYDAAVRAGAALVYPLTDEPWGVRRFFVRDPTGRVVNVLSHRVDRPASPAT